MKTLPQIKKNVLLFLAVIGPSVITTMAGNDGAGVTTYSLAGANLGYSILFTLIFLTILYAVTQEMGSRIAIVTGKGLGDLIRERFGIKISLILFIVLFTANFGSVLTNVSALKTASNLLGLPAFPFVVLIIAFSFFIVTKANYQTNQKIFLTGMLLYFSYVFSALKGRPDWSQAFGSLVVPTVNIFSREYIITAIAVLGTTITPWGQFFVQSYMKDKNVPIENLGLAKIEAYFGAFLSNFFTFFIMVATAATLFVNKIQLTSGEQAAMAIKPFAGEFSGVLFAIGLVNAAIIGMIIVSLSSAYAFSEFFGFEGTLDAPYQKSRLFYGIFIFNLIAAALLVLTPWVSLFKIVLYTQSFNAFLLPVIFYFLLTITNNKDLMGKHVNSKAYNYIAIGASILIIFSAIFTVVTSFTM